MRWAALALILSAAPVLADVCVAKSDLVTSVPDGAHVGAPLPGSHAQATGPGGIRGAWYEQATDVYGHGIMGKVADAERLVVHVQRDGEGGCPYVRTEAGEDHVFEDIAPRVADVDGDGRSEIITVRSSLTQGAQLVVYALRRDTLQILAATPYIGRRHRWLAPAAVGDLDGDGHIEIAYVDRPHLAKTLRIWRYAHGELREVASAGDLTNHAIGDEVIHGGLRDCGQGPEIVLSDAGRDRMLAVTFDGETFVARDIGAFTPLAAELAVACR
ncbi:Repeat domain-containing protein [Jannaschia faecimaris]|uniref:Repeat domain-containing protein n=1 Tax=Jannaschia faecimaris TaxID=1244108 RepID=A0A1H3N4J0_9RHOB|nr:VCBS repeat-containing protein [Jannaschia faecimaris]SDY83756.1 Repeat domain-containing protein [Jannaschia faecimaris]